MKNVQTEWVMLYIRRWLKASMQYEDDSQEERHKGAPQGGVISPLPAHLFIHYAFDEWMKREFPYIPLKDLLMMQCCTVIRKSKRSLTMTNWRRA